MLDLSPAGYALLPLRAFLGATFCFAGLQKLANPDFLDAASPISIQAQLAGSIRRSPVGDLLQPLAHHAVAVGVLMALGELAVGLGTLAGLFTRVAAVGGALISLSLFLTVSFHSSPYYTGSDIVFFFAWTPLILAGGGPLALDSWVAATVARRAGAAGRSERAAVAPSAADPVRRRLLGILAGGLGFVGLLTAGLTAGIGRALHTPTRRAALPSLGTPDASAPPNSPAVSPAPSSNSAAATPPASTQPGHLIGSASAVPVDGAASFRDPKTGDPALVVQPKAGVFRAYDAVCPHAGCTVGYDPGAAMIVCPCHGSRFDPATGAVLQGPAPTGLAPIPIRESDGRLYVD